MPRVLVTGAAGFIGSHLLEYLLERGHSVVGMDNLATGDVANIQHLTGRDFVFVRHDITNFIAIEGPLDYVFHFASPASPVDYLKLPIQTLKVGSLGTHNCLGLALAKSARFLLASTSEVYGDPLVHPQQEDYWGNVNPVGPRGVYDEAKRFAEAITMAYQRVHGIETRIARIFNTYGPRMRVDDGRAIPAFLSQALRGEDVTVFGDGSQTRSLCYVSDLVDGIHRLMTSEVREPVNIGNPAELSMRALAETIVRLALSDRGTPAAGRRSETAPARHHARPRAPGLGAQDRPARGSAADDRVLQMPARPLAGAEIAPGGFALSSRSATATTGGGTP
jgi:dTDP-glucose 4,6-dehydratase